MILQIKKGAQTGMSVDLNFWKYQKGVCLDNAAVYKKACGEQEEVGGLEILPIGEILERIAASFAGWIPLDRFHYEKKEGAGSFQISTIPHIHYNAVIHRAKTQTKATSFMRFGRGWANRPCQCKTAQLADKDTARRLLQELLQKSIGRVTADFLRRTYYA